MAAAQADGWLKQNFSIRAFLQGLAAAGLIWLAIVLWVSLNAGKALQAQQDRLASQTVIIDRADDMPSQEVVTRPATAPVETYSIDEKLESGLTRAPVEGLSEASLFGRKPMIRRADGMTVFEAYRRPFDLQASDKPVIAIAIKGLGLSDIATESTIRSMPPAISLIMSPYAPTIDFWTSEARARGHEVWLSLPVETHDYPADDPGPHTMLINAPERENQTKLEWLLSRPEGYIGFVTGHRPAFMESTNDMRPLIGNIYNRGLGFVDGALSPSPTPQTMAAGMNAPYATIDLWLDSGNATQQGLRQALQELEKIAREKGMATGIIHPLPVSYQEVLSWTRTLPDKGLVLAPLSAATGY